MAKTAKVTNSENSVKAPSAEAIASARAVLEAARANRPAPTRYGNTVAVVNPAPVGEDRLPRQARAVLTALRGFKKPVGVNELCAVLDREGSPLETRQGAYRIYTFYRKRLLDEKRISLS